MSLAAGCESPPGPEPEPITIQTFTPPALLAVRHEGSPDWHAFTTADKSRFVIGATGPYRVAIACVEERAGGELVTVKEVARTLDDSREIEHDCRIPSSPHLVHGVMKQAGRVFLGDNDTPALMPDEAFALSANPGTFDLVMLFDGAEAGVEDIALRRAMPIASDTVLGVIDAAQEDTEALVPVSFRCNNCAAGESISSTVYLLAGNTRAELLVSPGDGATWQTSLVPDAALQDSDRQLVQFSATTQAASGDLVRHQLRLLARDVRVGAPTQVTLPAALGPVTFEMTPEGLAASLPPLPAHDTVTVLANNLAAGEPDLVQGAIEASEAFLAAVGATSLTLDIGEIPGFKREWHDALVRARSHGLSVTHRAESGAAATLQVAEHPPSQPGDDAGAAGH